MDTKYCGKERRKIPIVTLRYKSQSKILFLCVERTINVKHSIFKKENKVKDEMIENNLHVLEIQIAGLVSKCAENQN
jgi:hypothetical protein